MISTYHKFVKTTPNPRATKNKSGELLLFPVPPVGVAEGLAATEVGAGVAVADMMKAGFVLC
jgi:hypothetical protein